MCKPECLQEVTDGWRKGAEGQGDIAVPITFFNALSDYIISNSLVERPKYTVTLLSSESIVAVSVVSESITDFGQGARCWHKVINILKYTALFSSRFFWTS